MTMNALETGPDVCYPEPMDLTPINLPTASELEELGSDQDAVLAQLAKRALKLGAIFYVHCRRVLSQADVDEIRAGRFS